MYYCYHERINAAVKATPIHSIACKTAIRQLLRLLLLLLLVALRTVVKHRAVAEAVAAAVAGKDQAVAAATVIPSGP
eukprot:14844-Heterococcus_DN1.PRE.3